MILDALFVQISFWKEIWDVSCLKSSKSGKEEEVTQENARNGIYLLENVSFKKGEEWSISF